MYKTHICKGERRKNIPVDDLLSGDKEEKESLIKSRTCRTLMAVIYRHSCLCVWIDHKLVKKVVEEMEGKWESERKMQLTKHDNRLDDQTFQRKASVISFFPFFPAFSAFDMTFPSVYLWDNRQVLFMNSNEFSFLSALLMCVLVIGPLTLPHTFGTQHSLTKPSKFRRVKQINYDNDFSDNTLPPGKTHTLISPLLQRGVVVCQAITCPVPKCPHPEFVEGSCCPVCKSE